MGSEAAYSSNMSMYPEPTLRCTFLGDSEGKPQQTTVSNPKGLHWRAHGGDTLQLGTAGILPISLLGHLRLDNAGISPVHNRRVRHCLDCPCTAGRRQVLRILCSWAVPRGARRTQTSQNETIPRGWGITRWGIAKKSIALCSYRRWMEGLGTVTVTVIATRGGVAATGCSPLRRAD